MKYSALIISFSAVLLGKFLPALADPVSFSTLQPVLMALVRPDALIVPVAISGRQYHFLLDTGISTLVIDNALASELTQRLPDDQVSPLQRAILATGIQTSKGALPDDALLLWQPMAIAIGDSVLPASAPWLGADLSAFTQVTGVKIDGILGQDIFRQFAWQVDNQQGQLSVWQQAPGMLDYSRCVPYRDAYDSGPELMLDYHNRPVHMTVDTGVYYSYIGDELIKMSRERPESAMLTGVNQPVLGLTGQEVSDG
ncbi:aspartyl protease family protein [Pseudomonas graminis]